MFTLLTSFKPLLLGGEGEMGLWAPVLLWNPAILFLKNIFKSIINHEKTYFLSSSTPTRMNVSIINTKCFNALTGIKATTIYSILQQSRKATVYHSGRDMSIRDIKTTTGPQMRDVHIRDKLIKDCILLGSP
jgi:hypothetical protein